ncbi:paraneoplastic antigen Ma3 homolog [Chrysemys picta bellii]|uniref:paraneoplastic antigen Ma3 homolog n=1 Tax=Chrysemys picta bellii TaxID=8478 RepID=UPI0032B10D79
MSVIKAVLVAGFPEEMEPSETEESLDALRILGRVKVHTRIYSSVVKGMVALCTHSKEADLDKVPKKVQVGGTPWKILGSEQPSASAPMSLGVDPLAQKLQALMVDEKQTGEELILTFRGAPTPAALRLMEHVTCAHRGVDCKIWREFAVPLVQEWECSDAKKRKWVLESLKRPAMQIVQALKAPQPVAMVQDYLAVLESVYGATDNSEDLYYSFCHIYQEPHEQLSDFIKRLEDLLQQTRKEGIPTKHIDSARLDLILQGT